jgi:hypothetical protein
LRRGGRAKPTTLLTGSLEDALSYQSDFPGNSDLQQGKPAGFPAGSD